MNAKRFLSVIICFMMLLPSFVKAASSNEVASLCLNSGIAGYYASVSKAAFEMVNVVFQDFFALKAQASKKEAPEKAEKEHNDDKAVISDKGMNKNFKTNLLPGIPLTFDITSDVYSAKITGDGGFISLGWMTLLIALLILSIKKKDDNAVSSNMSVNKRPVLF